MSMKTERLVVLLTPAEKARLARLAQAQGVSVGHVVRSALSDFGRAPNQAPRRGGLAEADAAARLAATDESGGLSAEQQAALERLADTALQSMQRANAALDLAFDQIETTRAYFAAKHRGPDSTP